MKSKVGRLACSVELFRYPPWNVWFDAAVPVSLISPRLLLSVCVFWTLVCGRALDGRQTSREPHGAEEPQPVADDRTAERGLVGELQLVETWLPACRSSDVTPVAHARTASSLVQDGLVKFVRQLPLKRVAADLGDGVHHAAREAAVLGGNARR